MSAITWIIQPEKLWEMYQEKPDIFQEQVQVVCMSCFDNADKKWWLLAESNFSNDGLLLSLENSEEVIASEVCGAEQSVISAVYNLLSRIKS